jgi:TolA-binding protein
MAVRESASNKDKAAGEDPAAGEQGGKLIARKFSFWGGLAIVTLVVMVGVGVALSAAVKAYTRAEQRLNAENQVKLTHIAISRAQQQALITRAQIEATQADAEKRVAQAVGIRRAQNEISQTLTSHYLQHEAIQAQRAIATSGRNNTLIYVPSGDNGVPLVQDPQNVNRLRPPASLAR